jgi:hypothetical protein
MGSQLCKTGEQSHHPKKKGMKQTLQTSHQHISQDPGQKRRQIPLPQITHCILYKDTGGSSFSLSPTKRPKTKANSQSNVRISKQAIYLNSKISTVIEGTQRRGHRLEEPSPASYPCPEIHCAALSQAHHSASEQPRDDHLCSNSPRHRTAYSSRTSFKRSGK